MAEEKIVTEYTLPSKGRLLRSTVIAMLIAAVILVTVILPAEYGIDPTGFGDLVGLKRMGEIKVSLAEEAALEESMAISAESESKAIPVNESSGDKNSDEISEIKKDKFTIDLKPDQGKEIKLAMAMGDSVNFTWYTDGGVANFDSHADSKELEIKYHNYEKGKLERSEGVLVAAFNGNHGWFWRNRTSENLTVTLEVNGNYSDVIWYD